MKNNLQKAITSSLVRKSLVLSSFGLLLLLSWQNGSEMSSTAGNLAHGAAPRQNPPGFHPLEYDSSLGMYGQSDHVGVSYPFAAEALQQKVPTLAVAAAMQVPHPAQANPFVKETVHHGRESSDANASIVQDPEGRIWVAYASYRDGGENIYIRRRSRDGVWDPEVELTERTLADFNPALGVDRQGRVWVVWSRQENSRTWPLMARFLDGERWSEEQELFSGKHYLPVLERNRETGDLWLAWEDWTAGTSRIKTAFWDGDQWSDSFAFPSGDTPQQRPSLADSPGGTMWLACDVLVDGKYDVRLARWLDARQNPFAGNIEQQWRAEPAPPRIEGHRRWAAMTVDQKGRVWMLPETLVVEPLQLRRAFNGQEVFYNVRPPSRSMLVWTGKEWKFLPPGPVMSAKAPALHIDRRGAVWIFSRTPGPGTRDFLTVGQRYLGANWSPGALDSEAWTGAEGQERRFVVGQETGSVKEPVAVLETDDEILIAWHETQRQWTEDPAWTYADGPVDTILHRLPLDTAPYQSPDLVDFDPVHHGTAGKDVTPLARNEPRPEFIRTVDGQRMRVHYGDLHHHTEYSRDPGVLNDDLENNYRYARDIRGLDFFGPTDHVEHVNDADWYRIRRAAGFFNKADFASFAGFEWTSEFYNAGNLQEGHHNVIYRTDGPEVRHYSASLPESHTPLRLTELIEDDIARARRQNIEANALLIPHDPNRWVQPVSWSWYNPRIRLMEIVQSRGSHELLGGPSKLPLRNDVQQVIGHSIQDGLKRGFRWGFVGSGDHFGRPIAGAVSAFGSREAIFDSLYSKRTFATSGARMVVDLSVNGHYMGTEWKGSETVHELQIYARGTKRILLVEAWKNGRMLYRWNPNPAKREFQINFKDPSAPYVRENWWYIRVTQEDGEIAWSSPVWFVYQGIEPEVIVDAGKRQPTYVMPQFPVPIPILMRNQKTETVRGTMRLLNVPGGWTLDPVGSIEFELPPESWTTYVWYVKASPESVRELKMVPIELEAGFEDGKTERIPLVVLQSPQLLRTRGQLSELNDALYLQEDQGLLNRWLSIMAERWEITGSSAAGK